MPLDSYYNNVEDLFNGEIKTNATFENVKTNNSETNEFNNNSETNNLEIKNTCLYNRLKRKYGVISEPISESCITVKRSFKKLYEQNIKKSQQSKQKILDAKQLLRQKIQSNLKDKNIFTIYAQPNPLHNFVFPKESDKNVRIIKPISQSDTDQTIDYLGSNICPHYTKKQEIEKLEKYIADIRQFHSANKRIINTVIFVNKKYLNAKNTEIEKLKLDFVVSLYKSSNTKLDNFEVLEHTIATLSNGLNNDKITVALDPFFTSEGNIIDINKKVFYVIFYDNFQICERHKSFGNCIIKSGKNNNTGIELQKSRGNVKKYNIQEYSSQLDYAEKMMAITKLRVLSLVKNAKMRVY